MGNSFRDEGWLTTRVSPVGWKCLPFCIRRRRVGGGVESARKGWHDSCVGMEVAIAAQSRLEYLQSLETSRH